MSGEPRHLRLTIEYDGTGLSGWQRQANAPSVQQHLEEALAIVLQHEVRVSAASRTDAGVHARGQVVSLHTDRTLPMHGLRRGLNGTLPPGISVITAEEAPPLWHPRFSSSGKRYRYTFLARPDRSPRWRLYAWYRPVLRDLEAMAEAGRALIGEHDFAAFKASDCTSKHSRRRIHAVEIATPEPGIVTVEVRGNAFLRNMVRIVAGTLAQVGERKMEPSQVAEILAARDRRQAGQTAPPHGLELMEVFYDGSRRYVPGGIRPKSGADEV